MNWLWFIPILLIMVVIHELGHFLTARFFGMKVHEFGIGFPPKVWSRKTKDGMEWSINALPIGGFVRIEGENGDSKDPNAFGSKPAWQRVIVLAAGSFMNLLLAFALFYVVTAVSGKEIEVGRPGIVNVMPNSPAALAGLQSGDVFLTVNGKAVKTTGDFQIEAALDKNNALQVVMERDGKQYSTSVLPRKNPPEGEGAIGIEMGNVVKTDQIILANAVALNKMLGTNFADRDQIVTVDGKTFGTNIELLQYIYKSTTGSVKVVAKRGEQIITADIPVRTYVNYVFAKSAAANNQLPVGAFITRLNETPINGQVQYYDYLTANAGKPITLYYKTGPEAAEQSIALGNVDATGENRAPRVSNNAFGLYRATTKINYNPIEAASEAWDQTTFAITLIPRTFKGLFDGSVSVSNLAGPIGMAQITDTVVSRANESGGIWSVFRSLALLMAMLSVNLGVVNLLPLPALDGGRLIFVFIEMLMGGKRVPPEKESLVHVAGMIALLTMMVAIAWQDLVRLVSGTGF